MAFFVRKKTGELKPDFSVKAGYGDFDTYNMSASINLSFCLLKGGGKEERKIISYCNLLSCIVTFIK